MSGPGARASDLTWPRRALVVACVAMAAVVVVLALAPRGRLASPGPLSAQHQKRGLECTACHAASGGGEVVDRRQVVLHVGGMASVLCYTVVLCHVKRLA